MLPSVSGMSSSPSTPVLTPYRQQRPKSAKLKESGSDVSLTTITPLPTFQAPRPNNLSPKNGPMRLPNGERPQSAASNGYLPKAWGSPEKDIARGPESGPASRFHRTAAEQLQYELRQTGVALQEAHAQLVDEKEATLLAQQLERMAAAEAQKAHALVEKAARERELAGAKFAQQMSEQRK